MYVHAFKVQVYMVVIWFRSWNKICLLKMGGQGTWNEVWVGRGDIIANSP